MCDTIMLLAREETHLPVCGWSQTCLGLSDLDRQDPHKALLGSLAPDQVMLRELDLLLKTTERLLQVGLLRL